MSHIVTTPDADTYRIDLECGGVLWCYRMPNGTRYASSGADEVLMELYERKDGRWPTVVYKRAEATPGEIGELRGDPDGPPAPNLLPALKRLFASILKEHRACAEVG